MPPGYHYHIFISYSRSGDVPSWVHTHFLPVLTNRMDAVLNERPQIFIDQQIDVGSDWPESLTRLRLRPTSLATIDDGHSG